jgi:regulator of replication initiation timing
MTIEEYIAVLEGYTKEIYNHVDLEEQMDSLTLNLTQLHSKMDNYLTEISKLKIERAKNQKNTNDPYDL